MEKVSLYIKRLDDDGNEVSFPNDILPAVIGTYEYSATRMGSAPTIEAELMYPTCLDNEWTYKEYVEFNGEKYYVSQIPSSSKENTDQRYKHEITFTSERIVLENIYAYDVVSESTETQYKDRYRSNTTTFSFYGTIEEFVARINDSLVYSGVLTITEDEEGNKVYDGYHVVVDDGVETDSLEVSFEDLKVSEALQEIYNVYELTYYWDGKECHVGNALYTIDDALEYGKGNGLLSIEKTNNNNALVDRVTGYGGSTNIQYYYPNSSATGSAIFDVYDGEVKRDSTDGITVDLSTIIKYCTNYEGTSWVYCKAENNTATVSLVSAVQSFYSNDGNTRVDGSYVVVGYTQSYTSSGTKTGEFTSSFIFSIDAKAGNYIDLSSFSIDFDDDELTGITDTAIHVQKSDNEPQFTYVLGENSGNTADDLRTSYYRVEEDGRYWILVEFTCGYEWADVESGTTYSKMYYFSPSGGTIAPTDGTDATEYFEYGDDGDTIAYSSSGITIDDDSGVTAKTVTYEFDTSEKVWTSTESDTDSALKVTITDREWMSVCSKLMPSIYRETLGADRFYPAVNYPTEDGEEDDRYIVPDTEDYYVFKNEYEAGNPHEAITEDEDIYPTIVGVTNADGDLIAVIEEFAYDEDDSDALTDDSDEENPEYIHSYFYAKLRVFDGDYGFNLFEHASASEEAYITLTGGNCSGCTFQIAVEKELNDDGTAYNFYNPVLTDGNGNLLKQTVFDVGDYTDDDNRYFGDYILPIGYKSQYTDEQQDTSAGTVWIALKKDNDTFGVVMPNVLNNYKPSDGDSFVLTGIYMPQIYIDAAERRLDEYLIQYMSENNEESFSYSVVFSRKWIAEHEDIAAKISENTLLNIRYNGEDHYLFVSTYTCKADDNILYQIEVELSDELTLSQGTLRTQVEGLKGAILNLQSGSSSSSSSSSSTSVSSLSGYFLSKTSDDTAKGLITFAAGLKVGDGTYGIDEEGNATLKSVDADAVDGDTVKAGTLNVSGTATMKGNASVGGNLSVTGDLQVTGNTKMKGDASVAGDLTVSGDTDLQDVTSKSITNEGTITTKNLTVTGTAHFFELVIDKVKSAGGAVMLTPADGFTVVGIAEVTGGWKLYFLAEDSDGNAITNMWQAGDQALCMNFNEAAEGSTSEVSNTYWWRLVDSVSEEAEEVDLTIGDETATHKCHWIVVSSTDYDGDSEPSVGNEVVMCGNRSEEERQTAIYISAYTSLDDGLTAPLYAHYIGIDDFSLSSHRQTYMDKTGAHFVGDFSVSSGTSIEEYITEQVSESTSTYTPYIDDSTGTWWIYKDGAWVDSGVTAGIDLTSLARVIKIEQALGGFMYVDETETVTLSVWDYVGLYEYTDDYTFTIERDSGDDSSDAVWNAAFAAKYDGGTTFQLTFSDLNFTDGSRTTKFWVTAVENSSGEELEEEVIEY